jgi:hypothetical protein
MVDLESPKSLDFWEEMSQNCHIFGVGRFVSCLKY